VSGAKELGQSGKWRNEGGQKSDWDEKSDRGGT